MQDFNNINDHDMLVIIHTKLERVIQDVKEIKDNTAFRVNQLELTKVDITNFNTFTKNYELTKEDMETRVRTIERNMFRIGGALIIIQILTGIAVAIYFK